MAPGRVAVVGSVCLALLVACSEKPFSEGPVEARLDALLRPYHVRCAAPVEAGAASLTLYVFPSKLDPDGLVLGDSTGLIASPAALRLQHRCPSCSRPIVDPKGRYVRGSLKEFDGEFAVGEPIAKGLSFLPGDTLAMPRPYACSGCGREIGPYIQLPELPWLVKGATHAQELGARGRLRVHIKADSLAYYGRVLQIINILVGDPCSGIGGFELLARMVGSGDSGRWCPHPAIVASGEVLRLLARKQGVVVHVSADQADERHRVVRPGAVTARRGCLLQPVYDYKTDYAGDQDIPPVDIGPIPTPRYPTAYPPEVMCQDSHEATDSIGLGTLTHDIARFCGRTKSPKDTPYILGDMKTYCWKLFRVLESARVCGFRECIFLPPM